jgi:hypothetical protein
VLVYGIKMFKTIGKKSWTMLFGRGKKRRFNRDSFQMIL